MMPIDPRSQSDMRFAPRALRSTLLAAATVLALLLAACGGGGGGSSAPSLAPPPPAAAPLVASISPTTIAPPARLTLTGSALDQVASASLAGTALAIAAQSATSLSLDVPAGAASGFVTLVDRAGGARQAAQLVTVSGSLAATSLSPASVLAGASLTIGGTGLDRVTAVEFAGSASAAIASRAGATSITVLVPSAALSGPVTLVAGAERATSQVALTVVPRISVGSPVTHVVAAGGSVTVAGSGFAEVSGVTVGGVAATITARSSTQLTFAVPAGISCGTITLLSGSQPSVFGGSVAVGADCALRIESIEFAQVLSQVIGDPRQRLVPRRETWVRAYVVASASGIAAPSVRVTAFSGTTALGTLDMAGPAQVPQLAAGSALPDSLRYSEAQTWMARLDDGWITPGLRVEVTADAERRIGAPVTADSTPTVGTSTRVDLVLVPLVSGGNTPAVAANAATLVRDELIRRLPVPASSIAVAVRAPYSLTSVTDGVDSSADWSNALSELEQLRDREAPGQNYYGLVRPMVSAGTAGIGYVNNVGSRSPSLAALGWDTSRSSWLRTLVHELGHNFSRGHSPCGSVGSSDPNYPYTNGALGSAPLFDSLADNILSPAGLADVMGYCNGVWFSDYNLREVQRFLEARPQTGASVAGLASDAVRAAARSAPTGDVLVVAGSIGLGGMRLAPVQVAAGWADAPPSGGEYQLRVRTVAGTLIDVPFDAVTVDHAEPPEKHFLVRFPNPGPLAAIELRRGSAVLAQRDAAAVARARGTRASAGASKLQAAVPSLSESGGRLVMTWDATQYPHASVTHVGAAGRHVVALSSTGGRLERDLTALPGGGEFEIALSDGLNARLLRIAR